MKYSYCLLMIAAVVGMIECEVDVNFKRCNSGDSNPISVTVYNCDQEPCEFKERSTIQGQYVFEYEPIDESLDNEPTQSIGIYRITKDGRYIPLSIHNDNEELKPLVKVNDINIKSSNTTQTATIKFSSSNVQHVTVDDEIVARVYFNHPDNSKDFCFTFPIKIKEQRYGLFV